MGFVDKSEANPQHLVFNISVTSHRTSVPLNVKGIAGFGLAQWPVIQGAKRLSQEAESFGKLTTS